jgi:hypothetical protein
MGRLLTAKKQAPATTSICNAPDASCITGISSFKANSATATPSAPGRTPVRDAANDFARLLDVDGTVAEVRHDFRGGSTWCPRATRSFNPSGYRRKGSVTADM